MTAPVRRRVLLVHGVGLDPALVDPLIAELAPLECSAPLRTGYRPDTAPARDLADLVDDVVGLLDPIDRPTVLVGLSGGATLGLALALRLVGASSGARPVPAQEYPVHLICHEPLVGPLAPDLHAAVSSRAEALADTTGPDGAVEFVSGLVGADTWSRLPRTVVGFTVEHAALVRTEVPLFVSFAPSPDDLARLAGRDDRSGLTVTVGADSPPARHAAAHLLHDLSGVPVVTVPGTSHLAPWQDPTGYARIVLDTVDGLDRAIVTGGPS